MTDDKKVVTKQVRPSKTDEALKLLSEAHGILASIGGKDAAAWQVIAGRVQTTIGYVEKYK